MAWMDGMGSWLRQVIAVVLLAVLVDLLLPNRTMQRYVRLVAGLFILLTVSAPMLRWIQGDFGSRLAQGLRSVEKSPAGAAEELARIEAEGRRLQERQLAAAQQLTAARLEAAIRADVARAEGREVQQVDVSLERRRDGSLEVTGVRIALGAERAAAVSALPDDPAAASSSGSARAEAAQPVAPLDPVAPVTVTVRPVPADGQDRPASAGVASEEDRQAALRIGAMLSAQYGIPADRVAVTAPAAEK